MTNQEILRIAMEQSARDLGCGAADFLSEENRVLPWRLGPEAERDPAVLWEWHCRRRP